MSSILSSDWTLLVNFFTLPTYQKSFIVWWESIPLVLLNFQAYNFMSYANSFPFLIVGAGFFVCLFGLVCCCCCCCCFCFLDALIGNFNMILGIVSTKGTLALSWILVERSMVFPHFKSHSVGMVHMPWIWPVRRQRLSKSLWVQGQPSLHSKL